MTEKHISFLCDDEPPHSDALRLHILAGDDYYLAIARGERWPMGDAVRVRLSGSYHHHLGGLVAAMYRLGNDDLEGAVRAAESFVDGLRFELQVQNG